MKPLAPWRAALALLPLLAAALAHADAVRPGAAATVALAHPPGQCPVARCDNQRTGRVPGFPAELSPLWKIQISGGLDLSAVLAGGAVVVASSSAVVSLDAATGKELARAALPAAPLHGPLVTTRGDRVVITQSGECVATTPAGAIRYRRPLSARARDIQAAPLPAAAGGVLVSAGTSLLLLDGDGRISDSAALPEAPTGALVEGPSGVLAVTAGGKVYRWRPPEAPSLLGSLGGSLSATPALAGRSLATIVDGHRLVFFDLSAGAPGASVSLTAMIEGPPSVGVGGEVWVTTSGGVLLAFNAEGREQERAAPQGAGSDGTTTAAPLVAEGGKVALARPSGEIGVWSRAGEVSTEQRACAEPLGLLSDGERMIVSCRDGTVAAFGRKP